MDIDTLRIELQETSQQVADGQMTHREGSEKAAELEGELNKLIAKIQDYHADQMYPDVSKDLAKLKSRCSLWSFGRQAEEATRMLGALKSIFTG